VLYSLFPILSVFVIAQRMPSLYGDRVFTASSVVVPLIFAFPLAVQKHPRLRLLTGTLGIILAGTLALSGFGFIRYGEGQVRNGEDWRGVTATLLTLPESNRLIVYVPPGGEIFLEYYGKYFPTANTRVVRTGLPAGFHDRYPPTKAKMIDPEDIRTLKRVVEAGKYSEIDLVLTHEVDPQGSIVGYLDQKFIRQREPATSGSQIRIIPFRALPRPDPIRENPESLAH